MSIDPRYSVNCWIAADGTPHPFGNAVESGVAFDAAKVGLPPLDFSQFTIREDGRQVFIAPKADPSNEVNWPKDAGQFCRYDDLSTRIFKVAHGLLMLALRPTQQPKPQTPAAVEGDDSFFSEVFVA